MHIQTEGIVLHLAKYSDKASILHLYTLDGGRLPLMVYGLHSKTGKAAAGILEPLMHIEIEANIQPNRQIHQLKTAHLKYVPQSIRTDMKKRAVAMFMAEVLYRTLQHPLSDPQLFGYLTELIRNLDESASPENLHICFLLHFMQYMGITPDLEGQGKLLDMQTGELTSICPLHKDYFSQEETNLLKALEMTDRVVIGRGQRQALLEKLCHYYELHLTEFQIPKSLGVLEALWD